MADFTITVTNSLRVFGLEQATQWGTARWGTSYWGYGSETTAVDVVKNWAESVTIDGATLDIGKTLELLISNTLTMSWDAVDERVTDPAGYERVYPGPTTDADERNTASFTAVTPASTSWAAATRPTTTWSDS